jgi:hypothetical protein
MPLSIAESTWIQAALVLLAGCVSTHRGVLVAFAVAVVASAASPWMRPPGRCSDRGRRSRSSSHRSRPRSSSG